MEITERTFHAANGLYFRREKNGAVKIIKTDGTSVEDGGKLLFEQTIDDGTWCSAVLTMSEFNERAGDWHRLEDHHHGRADMFGAGI